MKKKETWADEYGAKYSCDGTVLISGADIPKYEVLEGTKDIGDGSFMGCDCLTEVVIPDSVERIGNDAFLGCSSLRRVVLSESIIRIEDGAFDDCISLQSIDIPDSVKYIGAMAFSNCKSLRKAVIPKSVIKISGKPFNRCKCKIENFSPYFRIVSHALYTSDMKTLIGCYADTECFTVPDTVNKISRYAFMGCNRLKLLEIPTSVKEIGKGAFDYCRSLKFFSRYYYKKWPAGNYKIRLNYEPNIKMPPQTLTPQYRASIAVETIMWSSSVGWISRGTGISRNAIIKWRDEFLHHSQKFFATNEVQKCVKQLYETMSWLESDINE